MHHLVFIINFFLHLAYGLGVMTHDDVDGLFRSAIALHATALGVPGRWVTPPGRRFPSAAPVPLRGNALQGLASVFLPVSRDHPLVLCIMDVENRLFAHVFYVFKACCFVFVKLNDASFHRAFPLFFFALFLNSFFFSMHFFHSLFSPVFLLFAPFSFFWGFFWVYFLD